MKTNRFKQMLTDGGVPVGHMVLEFGTRGMPRVLAEAGVDFAIVDMEHTGFGIADIADTMAWFKGTTVTPVVRIPQIEYHFIARALDAGTLGIMAPNVASAADARAVVDAARYAPLGHRGVAIGTANTDFQGVDPDDFMRHANENIIVICQIESEAGLENVEHIASTPGLDVLWVGHFDLSQSLGIAGQFEHPRFLEALSLVVEVANRHGLGAGIQPRNLTQAQEWLKLGFNVLSYSGDLFVYLDALTEGVAQLRGLTGG